MNTVPKGWTRAAALQVNTAPSPYITDPAVLAVVTPYHTTPPGSDLTLEFRSVDEYNLWYRWWFDAPMPNPNPSFTQKAWAPAPAPVVMTQDTPHSQRPQNKPASPFDAPKAPVNPFDTPKPAANPFDQPKKEQAPWPSKK